MLIDARVIDSIPLKVGAIVPLPTATGTLSGDFAASIWNGSQWVSLGTANRMTVGLQLKVFSGAPSPPAPTTVHGDQRAPSGSYDRVRLVLQGVTATVARGSGFPIGGGTLDSDATVRLGGSDHYVELPVTVTPFAVEDDPFMRRVIVFQLNSARWLTLSVAESGQVEDAALQEAVSASTSLERLDCCGGFFR